MLGERQFKLCRATLAPERYSDAVTSSAWISGIFVGHPLNPGCVTVGGDAYNAPGVFSPVIDGHPGMVEKPAAALGAPQVLISVRKFVTPKLPAIHS